MKRYYLFITIICIGLCACESNYNTADGNIVDDEVIVIEGMISEQQGNYDDKEFLSEILQNGLEITNKFTYINNWDIWTESLQTYSNGNINFFDNGTCRTYFYVDEYKYTNTLLFEEYEWLYDADSNTIVTTSLENGENYYATVKYFGDGKVIIDGEICGDRSLCECRKVFKLTHNEREKWDAEAIPYVLAKRGVVRSNDNGFNYILDKIESYNGNPDEIISDAIKNRVFVSTHNKAKDIRRVYFYYEEYGYQYQTYPLVDGWQYPDAYIFMEDGECRVCYDNSLADPNRDPFYITNKWSYDSDKNIIIREDSFGNKGYGEVVYIDEEMVILKGNFSLYKDDALQHELTIINIGTHNRETYLNTYTPAM